MLQALIAYAERENLGDPDFETVGVRWWIPITHQGKLAGPPIELFNDEDTRKPKRVRRPFTRNDEVGHGKAHFLADNLERALAFFDLQSAGQSAARHNQHQYFKSLLVEAAAACPNEAPKLQAILSFLNDKEQIDRLHVVLREQKPNSSDNMTFLVDTADLLKSEEIIKFWRNRRATKRAAQACKPKMCLATGRLAEAVQTTEPIKGVPGGRTSGDRLIAFNKECPAFNSFGLEQAQNAPLSDEAANKFRGALEVLIEKSRKQGLAFYYKSSSGGGGHIHLHWTRQFIEFDPLEPVVSADPEIIKRLFASVHRGKQVVGVDNNAYYCLSLSGNRGRIVVRDWLESSVFEVECHVADWFRSLSIINFDGVTVRRDFGLWSLLAVLVPRKDGKPDFEKLAPQVATQVLFAALRGTPLPQPALAAALRRQQVEFRKSDDEFDPKFNPARIALIKAYLIRSANFNLNQKDCMTECLNPESRDPAYLCGRLFAVFDRLQYLALQNVNAGVVERYYASASTTPALVMGRLFRNAQFHLAKANGGIAENIRKDFEMIANALGEKFPPTLTLEEQGCFALGYYHQKAEYRRRAAERKEDEAKN